MITRETPAAVVGSRGLSKIHGTSATAVDTSTIICGNNYLGPNAAQVPRRGDTYGSDDARSAALRSQMSSQKLCAPPKSLPSLGISVRAVHQHLAKLRDVEFADSVGGNWYRTGKPWISSPSNTARSIRVVSNANDTTANARPITGSASNDPLRPLPRGRPRF